VTFQGIARPADRPECAGSRYSGTSADSDVGPNILQ
jgi:hypothetical protein